MADTYWLTGSSGDWEDSDNWTAGAPTASSFVWITAPGAFTVTLSSVQAAYYVEVDKPGATLLETASGSLDLQSGMTISAGATAVLSGVNTMASGAQVDVTNAMLKLGSSQALGTASLDLEDSELLGIADIGVATGILVQPSSGGSDTIAASHGTTTTLNGVIEVAAVPGVLYFGAAGADGTVLLNSYVSEDGSGGQPVESDIELRAGTVENGSDNSTHDIFNNNDGTVTTAIFIDEGATLDANGHETRLNGLQSKGAAGDGLITNSAAALHDLFLTHGGFNGTITGNLDLQIQDFELGGAIQIAGQVHIAHELILDSNGTIACGFGDQGSLEIRGAAGGAGLKLTGEISGLGSVTQDGLQSLTLTRANSFVGNFYMDGGTTYIGSGLALGHGAVTLNAGALISTAPAILANDLLLAGDSTIAEQHGKTLTLTGDFDTGSAALPTLTFGAAGYDGVVVEQFDKISSSEPFRVEVAAGTLRVGVHNTPRDLLAADLVTLVDAGAVVDVAGLGTTIEGLSGTGTVINSGHGVDAVDLHGGRFAGLITGKIAIEIGAGTSRGGYTPTIISGTEDYSGGTTIDQGFSLQLGDGGTSGSVKGSIVDNGLLILTRADAATIGNGISGSGGVQQRGAGVTTLSGANSFSGGVLVKTGELIATGALALGSGDVTVKGGVLGVNGAGPQLGSGVVHLAGGELLYLASGSLGGSLLFDATATLAAAHGAALTVAGSVDPGGFAHTLVFGDAGQDGVVVFAPTAVYHSPPMYGVEVKAGELKLGSADGAAMVGLAQPLTVDAGAVFDLAGFSTELHGLAGAGRIVDSGAAAVLNIDNGAFAGAISGPLQIQTAGSLVLSGTGSFTNATILSGGTLTLLGAASEAVTFAGQGDGELVIGAAAKLTGEISHFGSGESIDIGGVAFGHGTKASYKPDKDKLVVSDGVHSVSLKLDVDGAYHKGDFKLSNDHHGGTLLTDTGSGAGARPAEDTAWALADHHAHHHVTDYGLAI